MAIGGNLFQGEMAIGGNVFRGKSGLQATPKIARAKYAFVLSSAKFDQRNLTWNQFYQNQYKMMLN